MFRWSVGVLVLALGCVGGDGDDANTAGSNGTAADGDSGADGSEGGSAPTSAGEGDGVASGEGSGGDGGPETSGDDAATGDTTATDDDSGGVVDIEPCIRPSSTCELGDECTSDNGTYCACVGVCQGSPTDPPPPPGWGCVEPSSDGCPAGQPGDGEPCTGSLHCTYGLPAGCGGARADCVDGTWVVEVYPYPP